MHVRIGRDLLCTQRPAASQGRCINCVLPWHNRASASHVSRSHVWWSASESLRGHDGERYGYQSLQRPEWRHAELRLVHTSRTLCIVTLPMCVLTSGFSVSQNLDWHDNDHRSSSIQAYYTPVESRRKGWTLLIKHQARIPRVHCSGIGSLTYPSCR